MITPLTFNIIMTFLESTINLLKSNNTKDTPKSTCPNCWGRQEYGKIL